MLLQYELLMHACILLDAHPALFCIALQLLQLRGRAESQQSALYQTCLIFGQPSLMPKTASSRTVIRLYAGLGSVTAA